MNAIFYTAYQGISNFPLRQYISLWQGRIYQYAANLPASQYLSSLHIQQYFPAPEWLCKTAASSLILAGAVGGAYGLIGRVVYPRAGIIPLHYSLWFALAYLISSCVRHVENRFEQFMGKPNIENQKPSDMDVFDQIRYHAWRVILVRDAALKKIDALFSRLFRVRAYDEVNEQNVRAASYVEMCRYRVWSVFKSTVLYEVSTFSAYQLTRAIGFSLPSRTAVPLLIAIGSIVGEILLVPALYKLADSIDEGEERGNTKLHAWLPAL